MGGGAPASVPLVNCRYHSFNMEFYGTHGGITCDGCACKPIQGFRYRCQKCPNHDICESCYAKFQAGEMFQDPALQRVNKVSNMVEDHEFKTHAEKDSSFEPMVSNIKKQAPKVAGKKIKPNEQCPCGSGTKYKKCCGK